MGHECTDGGAGISLSIANVRRSNSFFRDHAGLFDRLGGGPR